MQITNELEGENSGLIIIDIDGKSKYRIINVYRIFNPMNEETEKLYFERQIELIRRAVVSDNVKP